MKFIDFYTLFNKDSVSDFVFLLYFKLKEDIENIPAGTNLYIDTVINSPSNVLEYYPIVKSEYSSILFLEGILVGLKYFDENDNIKRVYCDEQMLYDIYTKSSIFKIKSSNVTDS